jgi:tetraacyldisaccharide-1-P 4'-kinase
VFQSQWQAVSLPTLTEFWRGQGREAVTSKDEIKSAGSNLNGAEVMVVCGLARPESFLQVVQEQVQAQVKDSVFWPDHYAPRASDWQEVKNRLSACGAKWVLLTEKDAVKLNPKQVDVLPGVVSKIRVVQMKMTVEPQHSWQQLLLGALPSAKGSNRGGESFNGPGV